MLEQMDEFEKTSMIDFVNWRNSQTPIISGQMRGGGNGNTGNPNRR